jgi:HD superfamily phosphohydrolase
VLFLFGSWRQKAKSVYKASDLDALEVAIILHDIATPPFGHLFEYLLKEELGWDHEVAASKILLKTHVAEDAGHQIYAGRAPQVIKLLPKLGVDVDAVLAILRQQHPLSNLIFGTLDFDNIDNVWRMGWALGFKLDLDHPVYLAKAISVTVTGELIIDDSAAPMLEEWARVRRNVYGVMIFDQPTVASQAILTKALRIGLTSGAISNEHWTFTDEQLLERLMQSDETKKMIRDDYLGNLPLPLLTLQMPWLDSEIYTRKRVQLQSLIEEIVEAHLKKKCTAYVFKERGSFSKKLVYSDELGNKRQYGETTKSLVIYTFCSVAGLVGSDRKIPLIVRDISALFAVPESEMLRIVIKGKDARRESTLALDI